MKEPYNRKKIFGMSRNKEMKLLVGQTSRNNNADANAA